MLIRRKKKRKKEVFNFWYPLLYIKTTLIGMFLVLLDRKSDEDEDYVVLKA